MSESLPFLKGKSIRGIKLSQRESECIYHLIHGKTSKMIGEALGLSNRTVESYLYNAKSKLGVCSKTELISSVITSWYKD